MYNKNYLEKQEQ